jgi:hypothetical protein
MGLPAKMSNAQAKKDFQKSCLIVFLIFTLMFPFLYSSSVCAYITQERSPTIGEAQIPETVYANIYFTLNLTINDPDGLEYLAYTKLEISNSVTLKWGKLEGFSITNDPNQYCSLDSLRSFSISINATAYKLLFCVKLDWTFPTKYVQLNLSGTKVFNVAGSSGSLSTPDSFIFNNDLILNLETKNYSRYDVSKNTVLTGKLRYEDTVVPPCNGNSALELDGASYMNCGNDSTLLWSNAGTLTFWAKIEPLGKWQHVIDKRGYGVGEANEGYAFAVNDVNNLCFAVETDVGQYVVTYWSNQVDGKWHYYAGTWGNNELKLYVDGVQIDRTVKTEGTITIGANYPLLIGSRQDNYGFVSGVLDEIYVYNLTLTTTEVRENQRGIYNNETGLVLQLPFDGDFKDKSIKTNQCTIQGTTWKWTNGYANVKMIVEFNGEIKNVDCLVNSSNGWLSISFPSQDSVGWYLYRVYPIESKESSSSTLWVIADRLKIFQGGINVSSVYNGETNLVWYKVVYEFDNSTFDDESGVLFLNGYAMNWSASTERWEYNFDPVVPGTVEFNVTSVLDRKNDLTTFIDVEGFQSITVKERINPFSWIFLLLAGLLAILSLIGVFGFRFKRILVETEQTLGKKSNIDK